MDISLIKTVTQILFFVVIGFLAILSVMGAFVFIKYGRTKSIAIITSLVFAGLFFIGVLTAFITLQNIF